MLSDSPLDTRSTRDAKLIGYQHIEGLQILGTTATIVGAITAFLGIRARGRLRMTLASIFLVLALVGLVGVVFHNLGRLGGEGSPPAGVVGEGPAAPNQEQAESGERPGPPGPGGFGEGIPPPPFAPLSLSGFCLLGTIALLGRREE